MFLLLIFILTQTKHTPPITEKVVPQMFRNNSAKQGLIFPEKHPYFSKVPREVKDEVLRQAMEVKKEELIQRLYNENIDELKEKFKGQEVYNRHFSKPIVVPVKGIKKALVQRHNNPELKLDILRNILDAIKQSKYVLTAPSYKDKHGDDVVYHYLEITWKGTTSYINLKEKKGLNEITFYSITDTLKK